LAESAIGIKRQPAIFSVLRRDSRDSDLTRRPIHSTVLDHQHLTTATAQLQCADDPVVEQWSDELMLRRVHLRQSRREQGLLLVAMKPSIAGIFLFLAHRDAEPMEGGLSEQGRRLCAAPITAVRNTSNTR
jgi:hypothetical protein